MKDADVPSLPLSAKGPNNSKEHLEVTTALSVSQRNAVREELHRLLTSSLFCSSHRCQALLNHVVENALKGRADSLKERSLGIEVFNRDLHYDTNNDPVVRVVAAEVRKKLAQYYFDSSNKSEMRIEMRAGSYVPAFSWSDSLPHKSEEGYFTYSEVTDKSSRKSDNVAHWPRHALWWLLAGLAIVVVAALFFRQFRPKPADAFESFWTTVVASPNPVLLCVGHRTLTLSEYYSSEQADGSAAGLATSLKPDSARVLPVMTLRDSMTLARTEKLFWTDKKAFWVSGQGSTTFEDLQKGPVVLLGAFDNKWTILLTKSMRFHFERDPRYSALWIADQQNPEAQIGVVHTNTATTASEDYALVARILDTQTKQPTVIAAGITSSAMFAASDFITNPAYLDDFLKKAPQNWQAKNMELLIVAMDVNGDPGPPRVAASSYW